MPRCMQRWQCVDYHVEGDVMISKFFENGVLMELNCISIIFRVFLSILVGGILGIERGSKNRPAGFRTYILVCLGASLVMMTNQFVFNMYGASDPTRLGAQVISGIGFLGAGTIILNGRNQVKGVTTAACLWTAACCGLAIGVGFYFGAIIGAVAILFVLTTLHKIDLWMRKKSKYFDVFIEYNSSQIPFGEFIQYARSHRLEIENLQISKDEMSVEGRTRAGNASYIMTIVANKKRSHAEVIEILSQAKGVCFIEEL